METIYKGIEQGTEIVDKDGHKVGTVHETIINSADELQMITVQRGLLFKHDVGIPAVSIDRVEGGKIYLTVSKDTLTELMHPDVAKAPLAGRDTTAADVSPNPDLLEREVTDRRPNQAAFMPDLPHDRGTAAYTFDEGLGTAGVPGVGRGDAVLTSEGESGMNPTSSQDPNGPDRT
jgi:hypothetical protein